MDGAARIAGRDIWIKKNRKPAGVIADRGSIGQEKGGEGKLYWSKKRELTPEEVKQLPVGTEIHLEGRDRYGEVTWMEGTIAQSGKSKVFSYHDHNYARQTKPIKLYPNKKWMVQA